MNVDKNEIRNWVIYKITSPTGRIYIGKTTNYEKRLKCYKKIHCHNQHLIRKSLIKYGFDSHKVKIIDEFKSDTLYSSDKEMFWIKKYMSNYSKWPEMRGMNLTDGGEGTLGRKNTKEQSEYISKIRKQNPPRAGKGIWTHTEETKEKIRIARKKELSNPNYVSPVKGRKLTEDQKAHLSKINIGSKGYWKGKKFSESHIENMSKFKKGKPAWNKGKKTDEQVRLNISIARKGIKAWNKGIKSSEETRRKLSEYWTGRPNYNSRKKLLVYDKNLKLIKEVHGIYIASKEFNVSTSTILRHLNGQITKTRKFIFRYKDKAPVNPYLFQRRIFNMVDIKEKIA